MCCNIDLNTSKEARHFLGKDEPDILPKTCDNIAGDIVYLDRPAMSLFDKIVAYMNAKKAA